MTTEIFSLTIALLAVIVGPIFTYKITKKNLEFQFRTITQEKWIDKLEEYASSYLENTVRWIEKYPGMIEMGKNSPQVTEQMNVQIDNMLDEINSSIIKLSIILDDQKSDQKLIIDNVIQMKAIINSKVYNTENINVLKNSHEKIIENLKSIFHDERSKITNIFR